MQSDMKFADGEGALRRDFIPRVDYAPADIDMLEAES